MSDQMMPRAYPLVACAAVAGMATYCALLEPELLVFWAVAPIIMPVTWSFQTYRRRGKQPSNEIRRSIFFASLMLIFALAFAAGTSLDLFDADERTWASRSYGLLMGGTLIILGNYMPKNLPPLDETKFDMAKAQMVQRFAGWALVLAGIGYALAWFVLPTMPANIIASGLVLFATALTLSRRHFARLGV